MLRNAKPPAPNISREECATLINLKKNKSIKILKADKGNTTVVLDECDYHGKMIDHLACGSYRMIDNSLSEKSDEGHMQDHKKLIRGRFNQEEVDSR